MEHEHHCHHKKGPVYRNKTFIVAMVLVCLVLVSYVLPILVPFRVSFLMYVQSIWWAILLGLAIGGVVDYFVPQEYITSVLAQRKKRTIFNSVVLGFLMSVCSHGILAIAIQLHKKGASTPAVVSFLLASPWANLPLTLVLIGFFGLVKALYIIIVAIVIAIVTGLIYQRLEKRGWIEQNYLSAQVDTNFSISQDMKKRWAGYTFSVEQSKKDVKGIWEGSVSLSNMVLWWILIGMGLASLAGAYIPQSLFQNYMGPTLGGMLITLLVATILEVCSEGMAPLAFEIFRQTGALGNSLVFLMAGVATDYTEIGLLWTNVGKRTAIWLPIITVPQIIFWGFLANTIF